MESTRNNFMQEKDIEFYQTFSNPSVKPIYYENLIYYYLINSMANELDFLNFTKSNFKNELFGDYLNQLIGEKNLTIPKAAVETETDISNFYKYIKNEIKPDRNTVIKIIIGLKLGYYYGQKLMELLGYKLYKNNSRDLIVLFGINHFYDISRLEKLLEKAGQESLFESPKNLKHKL